MEKTDIMRTAPTSILVRICSFHNQPAERTLRTLSVPRRRCHVRKDGSAPAPKSLILGACGGRNATSSSPGQSVSQSEAFILGKRLLCYDVYLCIASTG